MECHGGRWAGHDRMSDTEHVQLGEEEADNVEPGFAPAFRGPSAPLGHGHTLPGGSRQRGELHRQQHTGKLPAERLSEVERHDDSVRRILHRPVSDRPHRLDPNATQFESGDTTGLLRSAVQHADERRAGSSNRRSAPSPHRGGDLLPVPAAVCSGDARQLLRGPFGHDRGAGGLRPPDHFVEQRPFVPFARRAGLQPGTGSAGTGLRADVGSATLTLCSGRNGTQRRHDVAKPIRTGSQPVCSDNVALRSRQHRPDADVVSVDQSLWCSVRSGSTPLECRLNLIQ